MSNDGKTLAKLIQHKGKVVLRKAVMPGAEDEQEEQEEEEEEEEEADATAPSPHRRSIAAEAIQLEVEAKRARQQAQASARAAAADAAKAREAEMRLQQAKAEMREAEARRRREAEARRQREYCASRGSRADNGTLTPVTVVYLAFGIGVINEATASALSVCATTPSASLILLTDEPTPEFDSVAAAQSRLRVVCPMHRLFTPHGNSGTFCPESPDEPRRLLVRGVRMQRIWSLWQRAGVHEHTFDTAGAGRFAKPLLAEIGVLPRCVERLLILDTDTVLARDLAPMWHRRFAQFGTDQVLMAKPTGAHALLKACTAAQGLVSINTGVMLYHVARMRQARWVDFLLEQIRTRDTCGLVRNGTLCSGDQVMVSIACSERQAACEHFLDASDNAEYCASHTEFGTPARLNGCRVSTVADRYRGQVLMRTHYSACATGMRSHGVFHYNCRDTTPLSQLGAPDLCAQLSIEHFYALDRAHGWNARATMDADVGNVVQSPAARASC